MTAAKPSAATGGVRPLARDKNRRAVTGLLFVAPALLLILVFLIVPAALALWYSLFNYNMLRAADKTFVGLQNYGKIVADPTFWKALKNSLYFTALVVPIQCGMALGFALLCNRKVCTSKLARVFFFSPVITAITVVSILWTFLLNSQSGMINTLLGFFGIPPQPFLARESQAMNSIIAMSAWQMAGYQMMIFLAGLQDVPDELYEAARIDGAGAFQQFRSVTMPCIRHVTFFVLLITTIQAMRLFTQPYIMTKGGPNESTKTVVLMIFQQGFQYRNVGYSAAISVLFFLFILLLSAIIQRIGGEREA